MHLFYKRLLLWPQIALFTIFLSKPWVSMASIIANSVSIGGASNSIQNNSKNWRAFGSFAGSDDVPGNIKKTVNSCLAAVSEDSFAGCNTQRVLDTTELVISFTDDEKFQDRRGVIAYEATTANTTPSRISLINENTLYATGSNYEVRISWLTLCQLLGGNIGKQYSGHSSKRIKFFSRPV